MTFTELLISNTEFFVIYGLICFFLGAVTSPIIAYVLKSFVKNIFDIFNGYSEKQIKFILGMISFILLIILESTIGNVSSFAWGVPFFLMGINPGDFIKKK